MMIKLSVLVDQETDVETTMIRLENALAEKIPSNNLEVVTQRCRPVIQSLFDQGMNLFQLGSQFRASQTLQGPEYLIDIDARFGIQQSFMEKLRSLFSSKRYV